MKVARLLCTAGLLASSTALAVPAKLTIQSTTTSQRITGNLSTVTMGNLTVTLNALTPESYSMTCSISTTSLQETLNVFQLIRETVYRNNGALTCRAAQDLYPPYGYQVTVSPTSFSLSFSGPT